MAARRSSEEPDLLRPTFLPEDSDAALRPAPRRGTLATAWQLPAFAVALTALIFVLIGVFPRGRTADTPQELLHEIEKRLNRREHTAARDLARTFLETYPAPNADLALAHFYCGRALRERALAMDVPPRELLQETVAEFECARRLPLSDEARARACLWEGQCLERLGQRDEAAQRYLEGLAHEGPAFGGSSSFGRELRAERSSAVTGALRLALVRVRSRSDRPDLAAIDKHLDLLLEDPGLGDAEKAAALMAAARAAFSLERWDEAERRFTRARTRFSEAASAGEATLYLARLAHRAGRYGPALAEAKSYLARAGRADDRSALNSRPKGDEPPKAEDSGTVTAAYILADSLLETGKPAEALTAFEHLRLDFPLHPEGRAAALRAVVCHIRLEHGPEALAVLKTVLAGVPRRQWTRNPPMTTSRRRRPMTTSRQRRWISGQDLSALVGELRRFFFVRDQYTLVIELARAARGLVPPTRTLETLATAHRLLAEQETRLAQAASGGSSSSTGGPEEADHRERARRALISAGDALAGLAEATKTEPVFIGHLWSAVECYRKARAYRREARTLETFIQSRFAHVESGPKGDRYAQASYHLGECYAALGRPAEAIDLFKRIVRDCPRNAYAYLARLAWAECCLNTNRLDEARTVLLAIVENTEGDLFTPRSTVWRRAIFLLGEVLHGNGEHRAAIGRLEEALARFPDAPQAQRGRYVLAECCRTSALGLDDAIQADTTPARRATLEARRRRCLTEAIDHYRTLIERYDTQGQALDGLDKTQRRNSAFFLGDCHFELGQYDQAIAAYERAAFRYRDDTRSVSAFVRISEALRRQRKRSLARAAVERARLMLRRVPGDDLQKRPAGMTRQQWMAWLDWAGRLE